MATRIRPGVRWDPVGRVRGVALSLLGTGRQVSRAANRLRDAALDLVDSGRRTYNFARPLYKREAPIGPVGRACLVAAAGADELLVTVLRQMRIPNEEEFVATMAEVPALVGYLDRTGALAHPATYHEAPRVPDFEWRSRSVAGRRFDHVSFRSPYAPGRAVPGAVRYAEHTGNQIAHAWMLRQRSAAPWVVCVHGAGMGDPAVDLVLFRAFALYRDGFNVAIVVLPHHGLRGAKRFELAFPGVDLVENLHGASQAIADVRAILAYIAARDEPAALHGISLGGYVAAAVAALEPSLAAVIVGAPVASIADVLRTHTPRQRLDDERVVALFERAWELEAVTSPIRLGRPTTPIRRIYAGRADRLVRPDQIERLIDHWGVDDVRWYSGGHIASVTAPSARRCLTEALIDSGVARRHQGHIKAAA